MKGTMQAPQTEGGRRSLFRRARRHDPKSTEDAESVMGGDGDAGHDSVKDQLAGASEATREAVATVDELARRIEELASSPAHPDNSMALNLDVQRAIIARANDLATATTSTASPVNQSTPSSENVTSHALEASVQQPEAPVTHHTSTPEDIEARLDAVLQSVAPPLPVAAEQPQPEVQEHTVTLAPTPAPAPEPVAPAAELAPISTTETAAAHIPAPEVGHGLATTRSDRGAAAAIGIDLDRMVQLIEEEAAGVHHRIELEMRGAEDQAQQVIERAEADAERIRDHGQAQARVLLSEVEEIISEAQQTGEQILHRANEEASTLRRDATAVLQQAQVEARSIVETARREGEQVLAEQRRLATVRAQEAMREQDRLKDQIRRLEERRRQVLESLEPLISQLTQMMPAGVDHNVVQLQRQQQS